MLHIKSRVSRNYLIIMMLVIVSFLGAKDNPKWVKEKITQLKVGNFALPVSQQPGPLIDFGQNVIDKGDLQVIFFGQSIHGKRQSFSEITPSLLYGINDKFSLLIQMPVALSFKVDQFKSRGIQDIIVQCEGIVYAAETSSKANAITLVGNISLPTGSLSKEPSTGFGSPSFFFGFTASHTDTSWYYFLSSAVLLTTPHNNIKWGNQFLYEFGLGRNISYKTDNWILNWLVEFDGLYTQPNKVSGITECNSGGNIGLLGPSLYFSTRRFIIHGGISAIIPQDLFGVQSKIKYYVGAYTCWTF